MPGTRLLNCQELKRQCEVNGSAATTQHLGEALEKKHLRPDDFSIRELAEAFMGREWVESLHPKAGRYTRPVLEAAVAYGDFSNITGQIVFSKILEGYTDEQFVFQKEIPVVQSDIQDMERVPGLSNIGDEMLTVLEGNAYPYVGFSEDYIEVAAKAKRGMIVALTKEAIFGDRTGLMLSQARKVGFYAGLNLEKRCIDAIIDENAGAVSATLGGHRYHWKGTTYATHQTTPWNNIQTSNAIVDWTDIENALLRFQGITDPYTGEPVSIMARDIIVTPQNYMTALRIINATEVGVHSGGYAVTGNLIDERSASPLRGMGFRVLSSQQVAARAATDTDWWLADLKTFVNRFVNWDITTEEAGANFPDAFTRDIVMQVKVTVKDAVSVIEPRHEVESRA